MPKVHVAMTIPLLPPGELCALLDQHRANGMEAIGFFPTVLQRTANVIVAGPQTADMLPGLVVVMLKEVSQSDYERVLRREPPGDSGPAEGDGTPTNRIQID